MAPLSIRTESARWEFLQGVFLSESLRDALTIRRGRKVYLEGADRDTSGLWTTITESLKSVESSYATTVNEEQHIKNIRQIVESSRQYCGSFLLDGCLSFGVAQKALNCYLKYLWCDGLVPTPPHCPFDAIIIEKLKLPRSSPREYWYWTYGDENAYRAWVNAAKEVAGSLSLSDWELIQWNKRWQVVPPETEGGPDQDAHHL